MLNTTHVFITDFSCKHWGSVSAYIYVYELLEIFRVCLWHNRYFCEDYLLVWNTPLYGGVLKSYITMSVPAKKVRVQLLSYINTITSIEILSQ